MTERLSIDIGEWIEGASANPVERRRRQAVDVLVKAVSNAVEFRRTLYLKGGTLMNMVYGSPRMTADVDFTILMPPQDSGRRIAAILDREMNLAAIDLGYIRLAFKVQSAKMKPPHPAFPWPTLHLTVGIAEKGTVQEHKLAESRAVHALHIDISFNEDVHDWQEIEIRSGTPNSGGNQDAGAVILVYSIHELIAEKLRAIIQQPIRLRYRRQDIYDIARILSTHPLSQDDFGKVFDIFLAKCRSRNIDPTRDLFDSPKLYEHSGQRYADMRFDHGGGELDFDADFARVKKLYRSMPWPGP